MNKRVRFFRALSLCCVFLIALRTPQVRSGEDPKAIPGREVDRLAIAALSRQDVTGAKILSHIDLTEPFETATQWTFVAVQDSGHPMSDFDEEGPVFLCLVRAANPDCTQHIYPQLSDLPHHFFAGRVVYPSHNKSNPLLLLRVCGEMWINGNCSVATALFMYDKGTDRFIRVFLNRTRRNNNEATRFVESGPLQGDVIVNIPTENAPYTYWIEVYRAGASGQFDRILRYRGHTGYGDGNPLAVVDSEMPEILRRLGLWQPGDPLPVPAHMPRGCSSLFMRHGEEWCK